MNPFYENMF